MTLDLVVHISPYNLTGSFFLQNSCSTPPHPSSITPSIALLTHRSTIYPQPRSHLISPASSLISPSPSSPYPSSHPQIHSLPSPTMADPGANGDRAEKAARAKDRLKKFQAKKKATESTAQSHPNPQPHHSTSPPTSEPPAHDHHPSSPSALQRLESRPTIQA